MTKVILTGADGTEPALNAAKKAAEMAAAYGGELHVVTIFKVEDLTPTEIIRASGSGAAADATFATQRRREALAAERAEQTAAAAVETLRAEYPDLTIHSHAAQGGPADTIVRMADELKADVVVVGNKRVQGVKRILGSIAGQIAREITCDLFVAYTHVR